MTDQDIALGGPAQRPAVGFEDVGVMPAIHHRMDSPRRELLVRALARLIASYLEREIGAPSSVSGPRGTVGSRVEEELE